MVSATQTINLLYGSGLVPPGTGVLLNDEMDDFALKPGTPNAFGVMGFEANAVVPGKRMLSSMTPTLMFSPKQITALGAPGGSRIITEVLLGILGYVDGLSARSEEHTSELQSLMRISYAVFCLKKKKKKI